jgi:hypothetical protein
MFGRKKEFKSKGAYKYILLEQERVDTPDYPRDVYRIQALVDIPIYGVKAGDLGGYVEDEGVLSHESSCWVGGNAVAIHPVRNPLPGEFPIRHDALVTGNAFTCASITSNAKVSGNAKVFVDLSSNCEITDNCEFLSGEIDGNLTLRGDVKITHALIDCWRGTESRVFIDGNFVINNNEDSREKFIDVRNGEQVSIEGSGTFDDVVIRGNCIIDADVNLDSVSFKGDTTITGSPQIKPNVKFTGKNIISGTCVIPPSSHVHDVVMDKGILNYGIAMDTLVGNGGATASLIASTTANNAHIELINQIEAEYEAYTTDIVKLIKYPAMVDTSISEVAEFTVKLRSAKRAIPTAGEDRLAEIAEALEFAFVRAENKVQTLVTSHLDEGKKKSLKDAEKMFKLACDEASPEPEKRLGFKAGIRALEGIVPVSEKASDNMKARIGILELEA